MPRTTQPLWPYAAALREIRGPLSVEKAARRVDVDRQTWTAWERGTQVPRHERLKAIVEEFGCPPGAIGYEPPAGWELVPADWIRQQHEEQMVLLRSIAKHVGSPLGA